MALPHAMRSLRPSSRCFSTSTRLANYPPESPRFIGVPTTLQTPQERAAPIKGVLPVPRNIFPRGHNKTSPEYLALTAPEPTSADTPTPAPKRQSPDAARLKWKADMAALRRRNLAEGLNELASRKNAADVGRRQRSAENRAWREKRLHARERTADRLTRPSVSEALIAYLEHKGPVAVKKADPANVERQRRREELDRMNSLHALYMHAAEFITTEKELGEALDKAFGSDEDPVTWGADGHSIWDTGNKPDGIEEMLRPEMRANIDYSSGAAETTTQKRMRQLVEELTGGRM
ncbi:hypothetical protein EJ06DRAFT_527643 [Trichodelitschia bisporula]|uniref:Uncharacterized protein n=1 Tax=Trichodelitschia bisporula TaxID=703511 RepID=A0A6G1I2Z4_9PEZI|nr:hypothetical protein EJ06DRAFT_527643 [Trichodelitschia bisporula]